jgi:acyl-CoA synthetase (NDP forming)
LLSGRRLQPLFEPRSVAVVGASASPGKWGHWLARGALRGAHRRAVYLVNRRADQILGQPAYPSLADLPTGVELAVLAVPAASLDLAVSEALAAGTKAIIAISAGLSELGPEGRAREHALAEEVRSAGAVLLGPNCLGVFDADAELYLAAGDLPGGSIGVISQSGNLALELGMRARDYGLGFSRFVSLGNQADLETAETLSDFARHDGTRLIAVYCEDYRDGRAFARSAEAAVKGGKPVILLAVGGSDAGARAARSHTGALVSSGAALAAACRAAGVLQVSTCRELVDVAHGLLAGLDPRGRRVGVLTDGGGHGVVGCEVAVARGLEVPMLSDGLRSRLAATLGTAASAGNPVDLAGDADLWKYERAASMLLESGEVDALVLTGFFGGYSELAAELRETEEAVATAMAESARSAKRPLVAQTIYPSSRAAELLREGGVAVFRDVEAAVDVLARLAGSGEHPASGVPALPEPASGVVVEAEYFELRALLEGRGLHFADALRAGSADDAVSCARELGYPVAVKALGLLHKSDVGGVALGIEDDESLRAAVTDMARRLAPEWYAVERMADLNEGIELIIGGRWDPRFGPIALVGLGGVYAEVLGDVAVGLAPLTLGKASAMLASLRGASLLLGTRGRPGLAVQAAAQALAALSLAAAEHPELAELEVNPLLVTTRDALGLDVVAVPR